MYNVTQRGHVRQSISWLRCANAYMMYRTNKCIYNKIHCWLRCPAKQAVVYTYNCWPQNTDRNNLTYIPVYVHIAAQNSCSCNYIFKVLFTAPSRYLFPTGFGHISMFRWALPPVRILIPKNINRFARAVRWLGGFYAGCSPSSN